MTSPRDIGITEMKQELLHRNGLLDGKLLDYYDNMMPNSLTDRTGNAIMESPNKVKKQNMKRVGNQVITTEVEDIINNNTIEVYLRNK
jgi:hypothetical protein